MAAETGIFRAYESFGFTPILGERFSRGSQFDFEYMGFDVTDIRAERNGAFAHFGHVAVFAGDSGFLHMTSFIEPGNVGMAVFAGDLNGCLPRLVRVMASDAVQAFSVSAF
jgi:hypothetical protein